MPEVNILSHTNELEMLTYSAVTNRAYFFVQCVFHIATNESILYYRIAPCSRHIPVYFGAFVTYSHVICWHATLTPTTGVDGGENDLFWRGSNSTCCFNFTTIEQDSVKKKPS